jgi:flavin reductase (DIM6/NTAB) family NADH-FMN oxidoreductase RutF
LLRPDQSQLAWSFAAGSGRIRDKLAGLDFSHALTGSPLLADCLAWFDCRVMAHYDAGDRLFFWADVVAAKPDVQPGPALREHAFIQSLTDDQRRQLAADRTADLTVHRPLAASWRKQNPC